MNAAAVNVAALNAAAVNVAALNAAAVKVAVTKVLVLAKAPVPGHVKTRLCPPCTPEQAAAVAAAALADTLSTVDAALVAGRTLVISGSYPAPAGWDVCPQRGDGLGERLANAFLDTGTDVGTDVGADVGADSGGSALLIGMDTPQVTPALLADVAARLASADAVLAPAYDGGWWALALREPEPAAVLRDVPMSTSDTARLTLSALRRRGLRVAIGPMLRDVDTAEDARTVARNCPGGRFAAAVRAHIPPEVGTAAVASAAAVPA